MGWPCSGLDLVSKLWGLVEHEGYFAFVFLRACSCLTPLPSSPKVDFTYPSLEEPAPLPPVVAVKPSPAQVIENEETGDNLEERLKSLNRPNVQDAAVPKSDSSVVVNPVSITRSIPEVSCISFFFPELVYGSSTKDPPQTEA